MGKARTRFLWVIGCLAFLVVLCGALVVLLPRLINLEPVKEKIVAFLSQQAGGTVEYRSLEVAYFPQPRISVLQVRVTIPEVAAGTVQAVRIYPDFLSMLKGKPRAVRMLLEAPEFVIHIPQERGQVREKTESSLLEEIEQTVTQISAVASKNFPGSNVVVEHGSLSLHNAPGPIASFSDLKGRILFPPGLLKIDLSCRSSLWERMSLEAELDPDSFKGQARLDLVDLFLNRLIESFSLSLPVLIGEAPMSFQARFKTEDRKRASAEVEGALPLITLRQGDKLVQIKGKKLRGTALMDGSVTEVSLDQLVLDYPRLSLSGKLQMDSQAQRVSAKIQGNEVDVSSVREAALVLAGEVPTIQTIFDYVRGGRIPLITLTAQAHSLDGLATTDNLIVEGRMEDGVVDIPPIDLHLEQVMGDAVITPSMLRGRHLEARNGNTKGRAGVFDLGLEGDNPRFHLEVTLDAELAQVLPFMERVLSNGPLQEELSLIDNLEGNAKGRLILGETLNTLSPKIEVSELSMSAQYARVPHPIALTGGQFFYEGKRIGVTNLAGTVGSSSFSELGAQLNIEKESYLQVLSGKIVLVLEEFFPWLSTQEPLRDALDSVKSVRGTLGLSDMKLKGPLLKPAEWDYEAAGAVKGLVMLTSFVPRPITVTSGTFKVDPNVLSVSGFKVNLLDASLNVSGTLYDFQQGLEKVELDVAGRVTPKDIRWLCDRLQLKHAMDLRAPITLSGAHISWQRGAHASFKGDVAVTDGPQLSLDVLQTPRQLKINQLRVSDERSQADIALDMRPRGLGLRFAGSLYESTIERIFSLGLSGDGWVTGAFGAQIDLAQPMSSTAQGKLEARALSVPLQLEHPVVIEDIRLVAAGNRIAMTGGAFSWGAQRFSVSGDIRFSADSILFGVDVSTDTLDLDKVMEAVKGKGEGREPPIGSDIPVQGTIRFTSKALTWDRFTWTPFRAEVLLVPHRARIDIRDASLCGIQTPGVITINGQGLSLDVQANRKHGDARATAACLLGERVDISGHFDLKGSVQGQGSKEELAQSLRGGYELTLSKGRIYQARLLSAIFSFLNFADILVGKLPDFGRGGIAYDSIAVKGELEHRVVTIRQATLTGPSVEIAAKGTIDTMDSTMDLRVLVAPFNFLYYIISKIPLVRDLIPGPIISVPVSVSGNVDDPKIGVPSASMVESELLGGMESVLKLPFRLIEPFIPKKEESQGAP